MMYELLKIYKTELPLRKLVLKHIRWHEFTGRFILFAIFFGGSIGLSIEKEKQIYLLAMLFLFPIVKSIARKLDREVKFVQQQYNSGYSYYELRIKRLKTYLREQGLDFNKDRLKLLIDHMNNNLNDFKIPVFLGGSLLVAILIPIWNQTLTWIYKGIGTIESVAVLDTILILMIIVISYIIFLFKQIIYDEWINSDFNRVKLIINDLNDIYMKNNW